MSSCTIDNLFIVYFYEVFINIQMKKVNNIIQILKKSYEIYANDFHVVKEVIEIPVALNSLDNI